MLAVSGLFYVTGLRARARIPAPVFQASWLRAPYRAGRHEPVSVPASGWRLDRHRLDGHVSRWVDAVRLLDGRVLVVGPATGDAYDTSAELYDPVTGTWSPTGNMLKPHEGFPPTLLRDGRVLMGDIEDPAGDKNVYGAEMYDPDTGTWSATGPMVKPDGGSAVLLRDGRVLVVHTFGKSELYDPASGNWTAAGQMLAYFHQAFASVVMPDGRVLVAGGGDGMRYAGDTAELYDPDLGTWSAIANMNGRKEVISATLLRDGTVLVMGNGFLAPQPPELYDPATGTWTVVGDADDCCRSATLLPDGMVLAAGDGDSLDAELYDPGTRSWSTTGSMLQPHSGAPATLLLDGTVLVAGGDSGAAELYVPAGVTPPSGLPTSPPPTQVPAPTPTPIPTEVPTPFPAQAGPVPPDARSWTVTVSNFSSQPATLFVAEENQDGRMGPLIGSANPNVVAPGATVEVLFLVPATGTGWAIFVNPGPNEMLPVAGPAEMSLAGQIHITPAGQLGWLSP